MKEKHVKKPIMIINIIIDISNNFLKIVNIELIKTQKYNR